MALTRCPECRKKSANLSQFCQIVVSFKKKILNLQQKLEQDAKKCRN